MLSIVLARPQPHFGRHRPHHRSDSDEVSDEFNRLPFDGHPGFPFGHHRPEFRQHPHGGHRHHHHHGFHTQAFGPGYCHEHSQTFGIDHPPHHHPHPNPGHESNSNYDPFNFNFDSNRHDPLFGFLQLDTDSYAHAAPNFNPLSNGQFPFPNMPWPFGPPVNNNNNNNPNVFNPFANWPMMNGVNQPPQQNPFNGVDYSAFTTTALPVLDPTSILENNDSNMNNDNNSNVLTSNDAISSHANTNDGNGDAATTIGWPLANEFFNRIPSETNSINGSDQLGDGNGGDATTNRENPNFITTTMLIPIPTVTPGDDDDQAVTTTTPHPESISDYSSLIDVRFGDDTHNKTTTSS